MRWSLVRPTYLMMVPMVAWIEPFPLIEHGACDEVFEEDDTIDGALVLLTMAWRSPRSPYSCLWSPLDDAFGDLDDVIL